MPDNSPTHRRHHTPRELNEKYQRAFALCGQPGADLALARPLLLECVLGDPENQIFTETFLQVLRRTTPPGGRWRGFWSRVAFESAHRSGNWDHVLQHGLKLLAIRPQDGLVLCGLARALEAVKCPQVARLYWLEADTLHSDDLTVQRQCGAAFARLGLFDHARRCWQRVAERAANDQEAKDHLARLAVAKKSNERTTLDLCSTHAAGEIAEHSWRRLFDQANALLAAGHLTEAGQCLHQAAHMRPGELTIVERLEDLELLVAHQQLQLARQQNAEEGDCNDLITQFENTLARQEIEVFAARAQRHPQATQWKLKLAHSLMRTGSFYQATQVLAEADATDSDIVELNVVWGECLQRQQLWDQALELYQRAVESADLARGEWDRLAFYRLGILALQLGQTDEAYRTLTTLASAIPDYKDVQQHLDKIDSIRHKDGFP